jgi:hypothetical protein
MILQIHLNYFSELIYDLLNYTGYGFRNQTLPFLNLSNDDILNKIIYYNNNSDDDISHDSDESVLENTTKEWIFYLFTLTIAIFIIVSIIETFSKNAYKAFSYIFKCFYVILQIINYFCKFIFVSLQTLKWITVCLAIVITITLFISLQLGNYTLTLLLVNSKKSIENNIFSIFNNIMNQFIKYFVF